MGYSDSAEFAAKMDNEWKTVICMEKNFGVTGCPHCARASEFYRLGDQHGETFETPGPYRKEAKKFYNAVQYFCYAIVYAPGLPQDNKLCLTSIPNKQVEKILKSVNNPNPGTRWNLPDALDSGYRIEIQKTKPQGSKFAEYSTQPENVVTQIQEDWWEKAKASIPPIDDIRGIQKALLTWDKSRIFICGTTQPVNTSALFRILPHTAGPNRTPFTPVRVHRLEVLTPWDQTWLSVDCDPARVQEVLNNPQVMAQLGRGQEQVAPEPQGWGGGVGFAPSLDDSPF